MSDHRHNTDRSRGTVIAECPNGCECGLTVEAEGKTGSVNDLLMQVKSVYPVCNACDEDLVFMTSTTPSEELE